MIIDKETQVAAHTSSRNTGVIHRPFYLDPVKKKVFATAAQKSYQMWKKLSLVFGLPWFQAGTIEVALADSDIGRLDRYVKWAAENGMESTEVELLGAKEVKSIEPEVTCAGGLHSKTDASVDFGAFTLCVFDLAKENGVGFLGGLKVTSIREAVGGDRLEIDAQASEGHQRVTCRFLINAAGGGAVDVAHMSGLAREYTDLHFRGEYWLVDEPFASDVRRNIYSLPRHAELPFLDPHFVVKADGTRQIGPNAVLVAGPNTYSGLANGLEELVQKILERPNMPKVRLFTNRTFLSLVWSDWRTSISKTAMCDRVRQFIPSLSLQFLTRRGLSGVRSPLIDNKGFVPEAVQLKGPNSSHILNFNSPGATGAPAYSAMLVAGLLREGSLDRFRKRDRSTDALWDFEHTVY